MSQPAVHRFATVPTIMPPPRSYDAPYFSGRVSDPIEDFLDEYEELANSCGLTERQKVETVTRYISPSLRDFWKSLDSYQAHNWTDLRLTLEEIYDGPSAPTRSCHSEQKLRDFARQSSKFCMNGEEDVLQYYRHFLTLGKPLCNSKHLSTNECNKLFWLGFHPHDRVELYARLIAKHPDQPSSICFDYLDVYKAARAIFSGNYLLDDPWDKPQCFRRNQPECTQEQWLERDERELRDPRRADPKHRIYKHRRSPSPTDYIPRTSHYQRADTYRLPVPAPTHITSFCFQKPVPLPPSAINLPPVPQSPFNPCAQVSENQLPLFNDPSIPNTGSGCGFKHGIDAGLAAQPQNAPVPMQRAPFAHEVPPHLPHSADSHAPSAHIEKVKEAHTVQVIGARKPQEDSLDKEDPFLQVFAAEMKKCKTQASKLPELQARPSIAAITPISSAPVAAVMRAASVPASPSIHIVPAVPAASDSAAPAVAIAPASDMSAVTAAAVPVASVPAVPTMPAASDSAALVVSTAFVSDVSAATAPAVPMASALAVPSVSVSAAPVTSTHTVPTISVASATAAMPALALVTSPAIQRELIGKPQAKATGFEEVASAQTLTITCRPPPPPQPPPQQPLSELHPVAPPQSQQQQHQGGHNHQSRLSCNKSETTGHAARPLQQALAVAVMQPSVLKDPDKPSTPGCREDATTQGVRSVLTPKRSQALIARERDIAVRKAEAAHREAKILAGAPGGVIWTGPARPQPSCLRPTSPPFPRCQLTIRSRGCRRSLVSHHSLFNKSSPPHFQAPQHLYSSSVAASSPPTPSASLAVAPLSTTASPTRMASDSHPADASASPTLDAPVTPTAATTTTATAAVAAVAQARDPHPPQRMQRLWAQTLRMCKVQIGYLLGLTGDGQDFDPPRGVRWAARLRS